MKKIKLLTPLFAATSLVAATATIVSCNTPAVKVPVTVTNVEEATKSIQPTISSTEAIVGRKFSATISWQEANANVYYIDTAVVKIGEETIEEYNEKTNPNGFLLSDYTETSAVITIPKKSIAKKAEINIEVHIKQIKVDDNIKINEYQEKYIDEYRGGSEHELIATYDVLRSQGDFKGADRDNPDAFIKVEKNKTYEFAFDLTKWTGTFDSNGSLFALMGYWNKDSGEFQQLYPVMDRCDYVWYGESDKPIKCTSTQVTAAFEFHCPEGGWGKEAGKRKTLFFRYKFKNDHKDDAYFQVVIGQEHKDKN